MSLKSLLDSGRLRRQRSSKREIADLFAVVDRDLEDAALEGLSTDRRFATAYNAALQLATIALRSKGYRAAGPGHHKTTFEALPLIMGRELKERADYFDACRSKRNVTDYDKVGQITESEAIELIEETQEFRAELLAWLDRE